MKMFKGFAGGAVRSAQPLTDDQMMKVAPSIFAAGKHDSRSERYEYIPTIDVLDGLRREGFQPFAVAQGRTRIEGKAEFTKHFLRLRHVTQIQDDSGTANEILLMNSHDGTSAYRMIAGCFRFVCANGLVHGDVSMDTSIRHSGDARNNVIEGAYQVLDNFNMISQDREEMKGLILPREAQVALATGALAYRYGTDDETGKILAPVSADRVLLPRRTEDRGDDLWATFNRLQENLVKGGQQGRNPMTGRRASTRAVTGAESDVKLNRALWAMADALKAAVA